MRECILKIEKLVTPLDKELERFLAENAIPEAMFLEFPIARCCEHRIPRLNSHVENRDSHCIDADIARQDDAVLSIVQLM
jgi:hypothetical protein